MNVKDIERSIIKTYRKDIWRKFTEAINLYNLVKDGDKIAVCISGGKDSFLMAKCFQELKRHGRINFDLEFLVMDPGYSKKNVKIIQDNAFKLGIPIHIFPSDIFASVQAMNPKSPCYMCARMRRGYLYSMAQSLGCNKIALGHHFNDVIETILMGIFYNGKIETMLPRIKSENFVGMELIRPMYLIKECSIINWANYNGLCFIGCACMLKKEDSKRSEIKNLIKDLRKSNKFIEFNIFKSVENINMKQIMGYIDMDYRYNYLDDYDE